MTDIKPSNDTDSDTGEIRALVDAAPPLSVRQRERLRLIFRTLPRADYGSARARHPGTGKAAA